jgi:hypothetical protein
VEHQVFRAELKRFDPRLDLLWNTARSVWEVRGTDVRGQSYLIYRIPLGKLGEYFRPVLQGLYECTPIRQSGGARAVWERLEEAERRAEAAEEKRMRDDLDMAAEEVYDSWQRRDGERINTTGLPGAGFKILDRRRFVEDTDTTPKEGEST